MPKRKPVKSEGVEASRKKKKSEDDDDYQSSESNYSDEEEASNSSDSVDGPEEEVERCSDGKDSGSEDADEDVVNFDDDDDEDNKESEPDSDSDFERQLKSKPIKINPVWQFEVKDLKSAIKAVRRGMPISYASKKFGMSASVIKQNAANYPVRKSKPEKKKSENTKTEEVVKPQKPIDLYGNLASAPCCAVMLTAEALEVPINLIHTMWSSAETQMPDYLKMNPQHTVPTLNDNGLHLNESRAMMQYLANKYAKDDKLYSKIPDERAIIDCRLLFDMGTLYTRFSEAYYPVAFMGETKFDPAKMEKFNEALGFLEKYIENGYVAGSTFTIADISVTVSLSTAELYGHSFEKFPKALAYLNKCKKEIVGYQKINQKGLDTVFEIVKQALEKAKLN